VHGDSGTIFAIDEFSADEKFVLYRTHESSVIHVWYPPVGEAVPVLVHRHFLSQKSCVSYRSIAAASPAAMVLPDWLQFRWSILKD
jgi:hypothetical protein